VNWPRIGSKDVFCNDGGEHLGTITGAFCLPPTYLLVLAEINSSTLKMEAICSSETSVATQQTTRRYIPEDDTFHNHHCENLKSYIVFPYGEVTQ
jgi:hypothetical protein